MDILARGQLIRCKLRQYTESVSTKIISLSLQKSGRKSFGAISVEPAQCGAKCWTWDAQSRRLSDDITPILLGLVDGLVEEIIKQQVLQFWIIYYKLRMRKVDFGKLL
jgi:hypothetical protein